MSALPIINELVENKGFITVIYTQDWHPNNHISFYEHARNEDRELSPDDKTRKLRPFDIVRFERPDTIQVLYPAHCVQGSWGAQFHPDMKVIDGAKFVKKGSQVFVDSYSAFADNHGVKKSVFYSNSQKEKIPLDLSWKEFFVPLAQTSSSAVVWPMTSVSCTLSKMRHISDFSRLS